MADDHSLEWAMSEEDELFLMANLYPRTTGLPMTVWVGPKAGVQHDVRIKVSQTHGNRMDLRDAAVVAVRPKPRLLHGRLKSADLDVVQRWIALNEAAIIAHWNGETDGAELATQLRAVAS